MHKIPASIASEHTTQYLRQFLAALNLFPAPFCAAQ
jgi:hypothetical protein